MRYCRAFFFLKFANKKRTFLFVVQKRYSTFASQFSHKRTIGHIGIWCNGNTTDSGPVILGSSPSIPTIKDIFLKGRCLFLILLFDKRLLANATELFRTAREAKMVLLNCSKRSGRPKWRY